MSLLKNKRIIINGGAGFLGQAFCREVIKYDGTIILADINKEESLSFIDSLNSKNIRFFETDINDKQSVLELIKFCESEIGLIDAIVNNAYPRNKNYGRDFLEVEIEDFNENISIHLGGYFLFCQQFIHYFLKKGNGNIVNISSIYGVVPPRFDIYNNTEMTMPVEYAAVKSAIIHLTKYMATYLKNKHIRVNSISLGGLRNNQPESFTEQYSRFCLNKGMLDANDVTGTLIFLLSDLSQYVNGENIIVDDGFCL